MTTDRPVFADLYRALSSAGKLTFSVLKTGRRESVAALCDPRHEASLASCDLPSITPEMVEAGETAFWQLHESYPAALLVEAIYSAMWMQSSAWPALIFQGPQYWKREQPMKIERGVMVMKDGKAWGISYDDGRSKSYGWIDPEDALIHNPKHCKSVTAFTYQNSPDIAELKTGKLVSVERRTEVVLT